MSVKLKIKELILKLLSKERAQLNKDYSCGNFDWGNVDQKDVETREDPLHNRGIYSMLEIPRLYPVPPHVVNFMREHELVLGYTKIPLVNCKYNCYNKILYKKKQILNKNSNIKQLFKKYSITKFANKNNI
jgi:hypothetical protein